MRYRTRGGVRARGCVTLISLDSIMFYLLNQELVFAFITHDSCNEGEIKSKSDHNWICKFISEVY